MQYIQMDIHICICTILIYTWKWVLKNYGEYQKRTGIYKIESNGNKKKYFLKDKWNEEFAKWI